MAREVLRVEGLRGVLDTLRELPPEIVSKAGGPVKLALRDGGRVFLDAAKANVRAIIDTPNKHGENESTGLLLLSLQMKRGRMPRGVNGERVIVNVKANQKYPAFRQNKEGNLTATQIGRQLEYGTERRDPMPWLRPAFDTMKETALSTTVESLKKRTQAAINKVARRNAGKR